MDWSTFFTSLTGFCIVVVLPMWKMWQDGKATKKLAEVGDEKLNKVLVGNDEITKLANGRLEDAMKLLAERDAIIANQAELIARLTGSLLDRERAEQTSLTAEKTAAAHDEHKARSREARASSDAATAALEASTKAAIDAKVMSIQKAEKE